MVWLAEESNRALVGDIDLRKLLERFPRFRLYLEEECSFKGTSYTVFGLTNVILYIINRNSLSEFENFTRFTSTLTYEVHSNG